MKKIIILLNFCLFLQSVKAQITVNYVDQKGTYVSGCDSIVPNTISPGPKGTNQSWDFTGLRNIYQDTTIFMDASGTPYSSLFPNADLVVLSNTTVSGLGKSFEYYSLDVNNHNTHYGGVFFAFGQDIVAYASQPCIDTNTVMSYGKTYNDTITTSESYAYSYVAGMDSMKLIVQEISFDTVDSWGTVILPGNVSYNSLRLKHTAYNQYDTYIKYYGIWMFTQTEYDTNFAYTWYTDLYSQHPMVCINMNGQGQILSSQYYLPSMATGLQSKALAQENLRAYPNPARTNFSLDISGFDKSTINVSLVSATGEIFFPDWDTQGDVMSVKTSVLKAGLYHWILKSGEGKFYQGAIVID